MQAANRRENPPLFSPSILLRLLTIDRETTSLLTRSTTSGMNPEQRISTFNMTTDGASAPAMKRTRP